MDDAQLRCAGAETSVDLPSSMGSTTYAYSTNTVTVTDPAAKWKKFTLNSDQTLASVEEPNPAGGSNLVSTYVYDFAGRLTSVSQLRNSTSQTRTFSYYTDGKPYQTTNPESGTTTNAYDTYGRMASVTDAKTFDYDSYNRVTAVHRWINSSTEDANQKVEYYYDSNSYESDMNSNLAGRLAAVRYWALRSETIGFPNEYAEIIESYGYTSAGTVTKKRMRVKARMDTSHSYVDAVLETQYTYDNEGRRTEMKYPAVSSWSRTFDYTYDNMGRPSTMTEALNGGGTTTWVSALSYNVAGQVTSGPHGSYTYNILGQLTRQTHSSTTFDEEYRYSATADNGKMQSKKNYVSGEDVTYTYDALNRLASASTTQTPTTDAPTWGNSYGYDVFGNLTDMNVTAGSAPSLSTTYTAATNRQTGATYDANGNDTGAYNSFYGTTSRTFDIDNRMIGAKGAGGYGSAAADYGYDPSNKRIFKTDPSTTVTKLYLHTIAGERIGEYQLNFNSGGTALTLDLVSANVWFGPVTAPMLGLAVPSSFRRGA